MQNTAYLLGQALKLSDSLHALYCEIKRDGDVPPNLQVTLSLCNF